MTHLSEGWIPGPQSPFITDGELHIWRFSLALSPSHLEELASSLSNDENERASSFYFKKYRDRFLAARGRLRGILSRYLRVDPGQVRFTYGPYGKPELSEEFQGSGIRFNLSHSGEMGLLAVTSRCPVGVDIEFIQDDLAGEKIARRFFSPGEVTSLMALPPSQRTRAFFTCWTRKEALIKAIGEGLTLPLDSFDVTFLPGEPAAVVSIRPEPQEAGYWSLHPIEPGPEYVGAAAVRGPAECWFYWV